MGSYFLFGLKKIIPFYGLAVIPLLFALILQITEPLFLAAVTLSFVIGLTIGATLGLISWRYSIIQNNRKTSSFIGFVLIGSLVNMVSMTIFAVLNPVHIPDLIIFRDFDLILVVLMIIIWYKWYDRAFMDDNAVTSINSNDNE